MTDQKNPYPENTAEALLFERIVKECNEAAGYAEDADHAKRQAAAREYARDECRKRTESYFAALEVLAGNDGSHRETALEKIYEWRKFFGSAP